jgi:hypothetical protein
MEGVLNRLSGHFEVDQDETIYKIRRALACRHTVLGPLPWTTRQAGRWSTPGGKIGLPELEAVPLVPELICPDLAQSKASVRKRVRQWVGKVTGH